MGVSPSLLAVSVAQMLTLTFPFVNQASVATIIHY